MTAHPPGPTSALVLFAHGARDTRWAEPFENLAARVRARRGPDGGPVTLAYLELMEPRLADAIAAHVQAGYDEITVVPVFFGQGSHLRRDLPALLDACRARHPGVTIRCTGAVGEDEAVLDAMAVFCVAASQPAQMRE